MDNPSQIKQHSPLSGKRRKLHINQQGNKNTFCMQHLLIFLQHLEVNKEGFIKVTHHKSFY